MVRLSKPQSLLFVADAFLITEVSEWYLAFWVSPILRKAFPSLPLLTFLPVSAMSMVLGAGFLCLTVRYSCLRLKLDGAAFLSVIAGIGLSWGFFIVTRPIFSSGQAYLSNLPSDGISLYLSVSIILSPVLEEWLVRGGYFEILRRSWGDKSALKITTFLFILPHLIWHPDDRQLVNILSLTVSSLIYTYVYKCWGYTASDYRPHVS